MGTHTTRDIPLPPSTPAHSHPERSIGNSGTIRHFDDFPFLPSVLMIRCRATRREIDISDEDHWKKLSTADAEIRGKKEGQMFLIR
jgi:hypothetical protein